MVGIHHFFFTREIDLIVLPALPMRPFFSFFFSLQVLHFSGRIRLDADFRQSTILLFNESETGICDVQVALRPSPV